MKVTFPHLGNTYVCVKALLDDYGIDYVIPPFNNKKALELGTKYVHELSCLPLKITLGNLIQAYEQGADTLLMAGGRGPCRFGYYCAMHKELLKDAGCEMDIITLELPNGDLMGFIKRIRQLLGDLNVFRIIREIREVAQISIKVDDIERLTFKKRPVEKEKGTVDRIYTDFRKKALNTKGSKALKKLISETRRKLESIEVDETVKPLKVGIVGEIYTTIDYFPSFELQSKLGSMGVEVDRYVTVSEWIVEHIIKNALHLPRDLSFAKAAKPYLGTAIGGHAQETVGNTVLYAGKGYDGVIQIYPLTCMPEIVAESILPTIERELDIPVLTLVIDEMTGEAGYMTRVEAFIDLLYRRRERKRVGEQSILLGN